MNQVGDDIFSFVYITEYIYLSLDIKNFLKYFCFFLKILGQQYFLCI